MNGVLRMDAQSRPLQHDKYAWLLTNTGGGVICHISAVKVH